MPERDCRQVLIIIPVGTSLLSNTGGDCRASSLTSYRALQQTAARTPSSEPVKCQLIKKLCEDFVRGGSWQSEILHRRASPSSSSPRDILPQELSYLALLPCQTHFSLVWGPKPKVALLASDSDEGKLCAQVVHDVLVCCAQEEPWSRYEVIETIPVEGLRVERRTDNDAVAGVFCERGIPNLLQKVSALCEAHGPAEVILNITGGFKGAIPYTTLGSLLLEEPPIRLHYLFEDTDQIIDLPVYPIGLDFPRWHRESTLMKAAAGPGGNLYENQLDPRARAVVREHTLWELDGALPRLLWERYWDQRDADPIQPFSERVITQFLPHPGSNYRSRLLTLMRETGPLLWYGDKVPMAAEHSARHHHHLFEFAQLLLTPIAADFLNEHERFVLLAALVLHDCGHTLSALPVAGNRDALVPLFPGEIRDLHHWLAWYRLTSGDAPEVRGWDRNGQLSKEVAWLCLYHRSSMGWDEIEPNNARCPYLEAEAPPPMKVAGCKKLSSNLDFPKLIALLRIIDGLDVQTHRVGPPPSREVMLATFDADAKAARARVRQLLPSAQALVAHCPCDCMQGAKAFVCELERWLSGSNASKPSREGQYRASRELLARLLATDDGDSESRAFAAAWTELARAYDEFEIRDRQGLHFDKHESVARVRVLPAPDFCVDKNWHFEVILEATPSFVNVLNDREYLKAHGNVMAGYSTLRDWITAEVAEEFAGGASEYLKSCSGKNFHLAPPGWQEPGT